MPLHNAGGGIPQLPALWAEVAGVGRARRHPFLLLLFRRTEKLPDTLQNRPGGIRTLPPPCEATKRPTGGNTAGNGREVRCGWEFSFFSSDFAPKSQFFGVKWKDISSDQNRTIIVDLHPPQGR